MTQKIIQIGNSIAITIPSSFAKETGLKVGQVINVEANLNDKTLVISKKDTHQAAKTIEVKEWLEAFNKKYKKGLTELAKR